MLKVDSIISPRGLLPIRRARNCEFMYCDLQGFKPHCGKATDDESDADKRAGPPTFSSNRHMRTHSFAGDHLWRCKYRMGADGR